MSEVLIKSRNKGEYSLLSGGRLIEIPADELIFQVSEAIDIWFYHVVTEAAHEKRTKTRCA